MSVVKLNKAEVAQMIYALEHSQHQVLVAIDGPPQESAPVFKMKIDGGVWSPPMGRAS